VLLSVVATRAWITEVEVPTNIATGVPTKILIRIFGLKDVWIVVILSRLAECRGLPRPLLIYDVNII
jgi:hypothetical protein